MLTLALTFFLSSSYPEPYTCIYCKTNILRMLSMYSIGYCPFVCVCSIYRVLTRIGHCEAMPSICACSRYGYMRFMWTHHVCVCNSWEHAMRLAVIHIYIRARSCACVWTLYVCILTKKWAILSHKTIWPHGVCMCVHLPGIGIGICRLFINLYANFVNVGGNQSFQ